MWKWNIFSLGCLLVRNISVRIICWLSLRTCGMRLWDICIPHASKHAHTHIRYNNRNCLQHFFSPLLSDDRRLPGSGFDISGAKFSLLPTLHDFESRCRVISPILEAAKYACRTLFSFFLIWNGEFFISFFLDTFTSTRPSALLLNPLCKWKVSQIVPLYVNFHFLSLPIPCLTLPLMLFNTQSFPHGWPHAVSAADGQKQREACREIQGLCVYGRMTLILFQLHEGAKGKKPQWTRNLGLARNA